MNIIFDNIIFSLQEHGGISVVWYELIKRILIDSDFNTKFIGLENQNVLGLQLKIPASSEVRNNLSLLPIKIQRYLNPTIDGIDGVFHSSYFRIAKNPRLFNITTVHDFTYEYYFKGLPLIIHHLQKSNSLKHSQKIICVSQNTKEDLLKFYPQINENKVVVVNNGVSDEYFPILDKKSINITDIIPFSLNEFVLYVGDRKSTYKNFKMLIEACKIAKCNLVIVGGGNLSNFEILTLNQSLGLNNYIHLSGISNKQLNMLYNCTLFFVYPSLYEGFGIPVIEAQKAGCPVICSNTSSIPEIVGTSAFVINKISSFKIADLLLQSKSQSEFQIKSIKDGIKNAQRFSWNKCYVETKKVYFDAY